MAHSGKAFAVIGAGYGDEGKGRTVDWLTAPYGRGATVVRSNGGAQAGHTVVARTGERHVFHHVGSGALNGAGTHLSRFMVSHPMIFGSELDCIERLGGSARISADPRGMVTTPWDMMLNQAVELARGDGRHGSCGLGFGETVARNEETDLTLTVGDLGGARLEEKLEAIHRDWLPWRLEQLEIDPQAAPLRHCHSRGLWDRFVNDCRAFRARVELCEDAALADAEEIVFEAAQGLRLDQSYRDFPFLTRSNTGLANIVELAAEAGIEAIEAVYVTRCYLTRHGRGPMSDERDISPWFAVSDPTNQPNPWQETLRFGLIDPAALAADVGADLAHAAGKLAIIPSVAVTCLDQARGGQATWLSGGAIEGGSVDALVAALQGATGFDQVRTFSNAINHSFTNKMHYASCSRRKTPA